MVSSFRAITSDRYWAWIGTQLVLLSLLACYYDCHFLQEATGKNKAGVDGWCFLSENFHSAG
jgi:hypothetical protein